MMNELEFFAICPVKKVSVWSDYTVHWIFLFSSTNLRLHLLHTSKLVDIVCTYSQKNILHWYLQFKEISKTLQRLKLFSHFNTTVFLNILCKNKRCAYNIAIQNNSNFPLHYANCSAKLGLCFYLDVLNSELSQYVQETTLVMLIQQMSHLICIWRSDANDVNYSSSLAK